MPDVDADVKRLASALGLGGLLYRSFRNPPVRSAPAGWPPAVAPTAVVSVMPAAPQAPSIARPEPALVATPAPELAPPPPPFVPKPSPPTPSAPAAAPAFTLLDRVVGRMTAVPAPVSSAPRPAPAAPADFPLIGKALGARGSN